VTQGLHKETSLKYDSMISLRYGIKLNSCSEREMNCTEILLKDLKFLLNTDKKNNFVELSK